MIIKTLIQGEYEDYADQRENVQKSIDEEIAKKHIVAIENSIAVRRRIIQEKNILKFYYL